MCPLTPRDAIKCGIQHEGQYIVFGAVNGTMIFQHISNAVCFIFAQSGLTIWNYIDDTFAAVEEIGATEKFDLMCKTMTDLGLPLNRDKVEPPDVHMVIMGISVINKTIAIPSGKMGEIMGAVEDFDKKTFMTKRELQSLLGCLFYVSKVVQPARGFLNRMLQTLRQMQGYRQKIDIEFKKDLRWFKLFLTSFNGCTSFSNWSGESDYK